jgi:hypothetical protein
MKKYFLLDDNCNGVATSCAQDKKSKATTAKMAKVDGLEWLCFRNY